jgi:hypothetical protein
MKNVLVATAVGVFVLAPAIGAACDMGMDDSSASASPPAQVAAPAPAATKVPVVAKTSTNPLKQVASKTKAPVPDQKVAVGTTN